MNRLLNTKKISFLSRSIRSQPHMQNWSYTMISSGRRGTSILQNLAKHECNYRSNLTGKGRGRRKQFWMLISPIMKDQWRRSQTIIEKEANINTITDTDAFLKFIIIACFFWLILEICSFFAFSPNNRPSASKIIAFNELVKVVMFLKGICLTNTNLIEVKGACERVELKPPQ